jgi:hypothetical protein
MKTLNLLILALLTPFILTAQTDETNTIGYRAGINLSPILFGEYGFSVERYSGNKSIYFSFAYKTERQFSNMTMDEDFDFNKGTYFYLPSKGFTLRLGYKFELKKLIPNAGFFVMPELMPLLLTHELHQRNARKHAKIFLPEKLILFLQWMFLMKELIFLR